MTLFRGGVVQFLAAFLLLSVSHYFAAGFLAVSDCDETFNFVEPLHYLLYGSGLQTWENTPKFALRSWLLSWVFAGPAWLLQHYAMGLRNVDVYFFIRILFGRLMCLSELFLVYSVWEAHSGKMAMVAYTLLLLNYPIPHAAASILPTSFAMGCYFVALGCWLRLSTVRVAPSWSVVPRGPSGAALNVSGVVFFTLLASMVGWPFAGLIGVPLGIDLLVRFPHTAAAVLVVAATALAALMIAFDTYYYCRPTWSTLNLVRYNVFGGAERGPELYGTEPWFFFVKNLLLNFHLAFVLSLLAPLVVLWQPQRRPIADVVEPFTPHPQRPPRLPMSPARERPASSLAVTGGAPAAGGMTRIRLLIYKSPFFVWLLFWLTIPHKEERFMVPAYPFLILAATFSTTYVFFPRSRRRPLPSPPPHADGAGVRPPSRPPRSSSWRSARRMLGYAVLTAFGVLSLSRGYAVYHFYAGPQRLFYDHYALLKAHAASVTAASDRRGSPSNMVVCLGKEWYRFPSSFFVDPTLVTTRFFRTRGFSGALPLPFAAPSGVADRTASWRGSCVTGSEEVNDLNREITAQYVSDVAEACDVVFDSGALPASSAVRPRSGEDFPSDVFRVPLAGGAVGAPAYVLLDPDHTPLWCRVLYYPLGITQRCAQMTPLWLWAKAAPPGA